MNKFILLLFILFLSTPVLATDYTAVIRLDTITVTNGNNSWTTSPDMRLNLTDTKSLLGVIIYYYDISSDGTTIYLKTVSDKTNDFPIKKLDVVCVKGTCKTDATQSTVGDIRLTLMDLVPISTTTTTSTINGTSDSPVYAYFYTDREFSLVKDGTVSFDAKAQKSSSDSGVSYSNNNNVKEVFVYFKRLQAVPVSVSVSSKAKEPKSLWDSEKIKFTIDESDSYVFTVKYTKTNPWGASTDTTNTYTLIVKGIESTAQTTIYPTAPYDIYVGDAKTVPMSEPGKFSPINGATINALSNNTYTFIFESAGAYNIAYTNDRGQTSTVNFNVMQKPATTSATPEPQATVTKVSANQQQTMGIDNTYLGIGIIGLLIGIIYFRKNKGSGGGSSRYEAHKNV